MVGDRDALLRASCVFEILEAGRNGNWSPALKKEIGRRHLGLVIGRSMGEFHETAIPGAYTGQLGSQWSVVHSTFKISDSDEARSVCTNRGPILQGQ
jgi:hypothetical protein